MSLTSYPHLSRASGGNNGVHDVIGDSLSLLVRVGGARTLTALAVSSAVNQLPSVTAGAPNSTYMYMQ